MAQTPPPKSCAAGTSKQVFLVESAAGVRPIMNGTMNIQAKPLMFSSNGLQFSAPLRFLREFLLS
jgi:hypothetical protein